MIELTISDADFDKLVAGKPGAGPVARIVDQVNRAYVSPIPPATEARHLQAIHQANRSRTRAGAPAAGTSRGPAALAPLRRFGVSLRQLGLVQLSGSTAVWAVVIGLFFVGATGGLAAAGVLPAPIQSAVSSAAHSVGIEMPKPPAPPARLPATEPPPAGRVDVTESDLAAQQAALAAAEQAIQAAEQAQKAAQEAAATSARCIEQSMDRVSTLVEGIIGATSPAQAQAIVNQARSVGSSVKECADQAAAAGQAGAGHAAAASQLAQKAAEGNPALTAPGLAAVRAAEQAARAAGASANRALQVSSSIVDDVSGLAASLIGSTLGLREQLTPAPPAALPGRHPAPAGPPAQSTNPAAWADWGMDYASQIMGSFAGGAGRGR